jgi:hypothetical protein
VEDKNFMPIYCDYCGGKLNDGDCTFCFSNSNALREFEEEDE